MLKKLKPGTKVKYMSRDFIISDIVPPTLYMYRIGDGTLVDLPLTEILEQAQVFGESLPEKNESELSSYNFDALSEELKNKVTEWLKRLEPALLFRKIKENGQSGETYVSKFPELFPESTDFSSLTLEKVFEAIARHCKQSKRNVKRYYYPYLKEGLPGLISKCNHGVVKRKDVKQLIIRNPYKHAEILQVIDVRLDEKYVNIIATAIEQDYLRDKLAPAAVIHRIEARCVLHNYVYPGNASTLYKIFNKIDERHIARFRGTKSEQARFIEVHNGHTNEVALYPGHIVQIDHKLIDVIFVNDEGEPVGRAWLTIAVDLYTRMIWGFHLSYDEPSIDKVIATLINGTFLKRAKERYGTKQDWPIYGKPKVFHFDNGMDFRSYDIERTIVEVYGAELAFRPIRQPRYGGEVERVLETIDSNVFHNFPGTTKSRQSQLRSNPANQARYTLEEARLILAKWIVDVYHYTKHSGLPSATPRPIDMYNEGIRIFGLPPYVDPLDEPQFRLNMMREVRREYKKYGIRFDNIEYKAPELSDLIGSRKKLIVKYDNSDISKVYVFHPVTKKYIVATGTAIKQRGLNLNGMSRFLYHWIQERDKKHAEALKRSNPGTQSLQQSRVEFDTMLYGKRKTRSRKKVAERLKSDIKALPPLSHDAKMEALFEKLREQDI